MKKWMLITGATSGLGEGLVLAHLAQGWGVMALGRNTDKLAALANLAVEQGYVREQLKTVVSDVTEFDHLEATIRAEFAAEPNLERVIANAGIGFTTRVGNFGVQGIKKTMDTNVIGACLTIDVAASEMLNRGIQGHLVGMSSVAGVRGLPKSGVYSASKAALSTFLESATLELKSKGIAVSDIRPGFIDTPINQDLKERPFVVDRDTGVKALMRAIDRKATMAYVPELPWSLLARTLQVSPQAVLSRIK